MVVASEAGTPRGERGSGGASGGEWGCRCLGLGVEGVMGEWGRAGLVGLVASWLGQSPVGLGVFFSFFFVSLFFLFYFFSSFLFY